jgi:galactokinase
MTALAVFAPARVNLIGEHTDYSGGLVLPAAIHLGVTVRGRPASRILLRSQAFGETVELEPDGTSPTAVPGWGRYVSAVARLLDRRGRHAIGFDGSIASTVPLGAGLSSSAALDIAVALALCRAAAFELPPLELAHLAQEAERLAVGVPCGLMDPATALLGRRGHALLLDCGTEHYRHVRLPAELAIVVLDSGVRHELEHSGYATRRRELERGLAVLGGRRAADVTLAEAEASARAAGLDDVALHRLRHVVSENERVRRCVAALEAPGRPDLEALGALFRKGHDSLRDEFQISTPELDLLVDLAYEHGAAAARMTGGGFGGSVVALAGRAWARRLASAVARAYAERTGRTPVSHVCATVDGAAGGDMAVTSAGAPPARSCRGRAR